MVQICVLLSLNLSSSPSPKKVYKRKQRFTQEEIESFKQFLPSSYARKIYSKKLRIEEYHPQEFAALRANLGYSDLFESFNSIQTYIKF